MALSNLEIHNFCISNLGDDEYDANLRLIHLDTIESIVRKYWKVF